MAEVEQALALYGKGGTVVQLTKYNDCPDFYLLVETEHTVTSEVVSTETLSSFAFQLNNIMKDYDA